MEEGKILAARSSRQSQLSNRTTKTRKSKNNRAPIKIGAPFCFLSAVVNLAGRPLFLDGRCELQSACEVTQNGIVDYVFNLYYTVLSDRKSPKKTSSRWAIIIYLSIVYLQCHPQGVVSRLLTSQRKAWVQEITYYPGLWLSAVAIRKSVTWKAVCQCEIYKGDVCQREMPAHRARSTDEINDSGG